MDSVYGRRFDMDLHATDVFEEGRALGKPDLPVTYFGPNVAQMGCAVARRLTDTYNQQVSVSDQHEHPVEYPVITITLDAVHAPITLAACAQVAATACVDVIHAGGRALVEMTIAQRDVDAVHVAVSHFDIAWLYPFDAETRVLNEWTADVTRVEPNRVAIRLTMTSGLADE